MNLTCFRCPRKWFEDACRVCELVDNDKSIKRVFHCHVCNANMCAECENDLIKRSKAFVKNITS